LHGQVILGSTLVTDAGMKIELADPIRPGRWSIGIRPERIAVLGPGDVADGTLLPGTVAEALNMDSEFHYVVEGADGSMLVVEPNRTGARTRAGDRVQLRFEPQDCIAISEAPG
jgi:hypothetical protein